MQLYYNNRTGCNCITTNRKNNVNKVDDKKDEPLGSDTPVTTPISTQITDISITGSNLTINYKGGSGPVPPPPPEKLINTAGYWGSSGNANEQIPLIKDIDAMYNILILTFLNFTLDGKLQHCTNCNKTVNWVVKYFKFVV